MKNSNSRFGIFLLLYLLGGMAQTVMAQKEIGVFYSNWFDYPTNWTNTGGCVWAEPELGWYKSADPAVIDQHTEWLVNNGADFVMFDNKRCSKRRKQWCYHP